MADILVICLILYEWRRKRKAGKLREEDRWIGNRIGLHKGWYRRGFPSWIAHLFSYALYREMDKNVHGWENEDEQHTRNLSEVRKYFEKVLDVWSSFFSTSTFLLSTYVIVDTFHPY